MRKTISIGETNIGTADEMIGPEDIIRVFIWDSQVRKIFNIPESQKIIYEHGANHTEFSHPELKTKSLTKYGEYEIGEHVKFTKHPDVHGKLIRIEPMESDPIVHMLQNGETYGLAISNISHY